jgi:phosphonate transport system ATP-binding protein
MIEVQNISKFSKSGRKLLNNISFTVKKGEFVGILGASGAGKTLTLRTLNRLLTPDEGVINFEMAPGIFKNISDVSKKELRVIRQKIGVIFQGYHLIQRSTVLENVLIGRIGSISTFRSIFYGFTDKEAEEAMVALQEVNMAEFANQKVASLSGGEKQRVAIARAIFQNPSLVLADEPISNLDPSNAKLIMKLIKALSAHIPVIGVFHQPLMTAKYCTRVIAIKEGQIVYDGHPNLSEEQFLDIYGLELEQLQQF